jgi:hypothetical protein
MNLQENPLDNSAEFNRRRNSRALVTALALAAFVVIIFAIAIVRVGKIA